MKKIQILYTHKVPRKRTQKHSGLFTESQSQVTSHQLWLFFQMLTNIHSQFHNTGKFWNYSDQSVIYKFLCYLFWTFQSLRTSSVLYNCRGDYWCFQDPKWQSWPKAEFLNCQDCSPFPYLLSLQVPVKQVCFASRTQMSFPLMTKSSKQNNYSFVYIFFVMGNTL